MSEPGFRQSVVGGGVIVQNAFDFDTPQPTEFWYVIKDSFGGMDELSAKMRNQVRRSFRECEIRRISIDCLSQQGYTVYCAAAEGYHVKVQPPTREEFSARLKACGEDWEFWGAFDKQTGCLVAFSMNCVTAECCDYSTMKADPAFQKRCYPYYGLIYEMNRHYLEERHLRYVCDGARSLTNHSNIQPFLIDKFRFRKAYCHLRMYYVWWLRPLVAVLFPFRRLIPIRPVRTLLDMEWRARRSRPDCPPGSTITQ